MASKANIGAKITLEGEKEYRQAISEINKSQNVLKSELKAVSAEFDGNANSIEALRAKNTVLLKLHEEQEKRLQTLRGALEDANKQYGEGSKQSQDWQIKLNNAYVNLNNLDKELDSNKKYLDEAKTSTNSTAKSIDNFGKEIKSVKEDTLDLGDVLKANLASQAIIEGVKSLGNAAKNAAQGVVDLATNAAAYADDMMTISTQTGISTDKLQAYNYMAELTDVSLEDMTKSMAKNIKSMSNAQSGSAKYADAYKRLKVEVTESNGKLRDSEDVYWDVIDALKNVKDQTERDSISMQLFGKSAQELNPLISIGSEGVANFTKEAERMGAILDDKTLNSLGAADDALQRFTQASDIAKRKIGAEMAPAFTEAADKITDKITEMDGSFGNFAGGALNVAVDGLGWIIDNANYITGGIGGIAAAMATFKAGSAIQTGMDLAIKGWQTYKNVTEAATIAQYALNVAQNLSPVGILATAVGALTAGMLIYKTSTGAASEATNEFKKEIEDAEEANNNYHESIKSSIQSRNDNNKSIDSEYGAIKKLSDSLYDLSDKEIKSNAEKAQMSSIVDQLNQTMPELNLSINEQTGLLNKQKSEVDKLINSNLEYAKVKAAQADLQNIAKEQYEAENRLAEAKEKINTLTDEFNSKVAINNQVMELEAKGWVWLSDSQKEYIKTNKNVLDDMSNLSNQMRITNDDISNTQNDIADLGKQWDSTNKYIGNHSDIDASTKSIDEFGNTIEETSDKTVKANEKSKKAIKELTDTYKNAVKDRTKDIKTAMGLFDEFALDTSVSGKKLMKNLQDQVQGMRDWAKNLQSLAKKGISEGLLKELQEMGPSAASQINALNKLSDAELKKYNDTWKEKSKLARKLAIDELSGLKDDTEKKIKELTKTTETELYNSGKNSANGFSKGFNDNSSHMLATVSGSMEEVIKDANKTLGIHSPSKVFEMIAQHTIEGFVLGVKNNKEMAKKSMDEIYDAILSKAQKTLDNYKVWHKVSLSEETAYWDEVRKQFKKGSQARIDADKEYLNALREAKEEEKSLNAEIYSNAQTKLDNYKVWHTMSVQDEIEYWDKIRKEITKGTQARYDADEKYLSAKKKQQEEEAELLKKQTEALNTYKDNAVKVQEDLVKNIEDANQKYNEALKSRTSEITSSMGLFSSFSANSVSGQDLLSNLQGQVTGLANWTTNLNNLKLKGIDTGLISELEQLGPSAAGEIAALNTLSESELNQYVNLWREKSRIAKDQAINELSGLKEETSTKIKELTDQANTDLTTYYNEYKKAMKDLGTSIKAPVEILKSTVTDDGKIIVENMTKSMKNEMSSKDTTDRLKSFNGIIEKSLQKLIEKAKSAGVGIAQGLTSGLQSYNLQSLNTSNQYVQNQIAGSYAINKAVSPVSGNNLSNYIGSTQKIILQTPIQIGNFNNYTSDDINTITDQMSFEVQRKVYGGGGIVLDRV